MTLFETTVAQESPEGFSKDLSILAGYGSPSHDQLMNTLSLHRSNRRDYMVGPETSSFERLKFRRGDTLHPLDEIALSSLAERFKISGGYTVTSKGLRHISNEEPLFEEVCNHFFSRLKKPVMFRTLFDIGIAFPSKEYTVLNHIDLLETVFGALTPVFGGSPSTDHNFIDKKHLYSVINIPNTEVPIHHNGISDTLTVGLQVKNSEVLEGAVSIDFKIIRASDKTGILLGNELGSIHQRHAHISTEDALSRIKNRILEMMSNIEALYEVIDFLGVSMATGISPAKGVELATEFCRLVGLKENVLSKMVRLARLNGDNTLYGWVVSPLSALALQDPERELRETKERISGMLLVNESIREKILAML